MSNRDSLDTRLLSGKKNFGFNGQSTIFNLGGMGAGGGDGDGLRDDFKDTAYWDADIITDDNGVAKVQFDLPDDLTTWNIKAVAASSDEGVGLGESRIKTNLKRFVDLDIPTYIRNGDVIKAGVVLANFEKTFNAEIKFVCVGCAQREQSIKLESPSQTRKETEFEVEPLSGVDELEITATVKDGRDKVDEVKLFVPVFTNSVIGQTVQTALLYEDVGDHEFTFEISELDEFDTYGDIKISRTFALEQFAYPADINILSTRNIADAILHDAFILRNHDLLKPEITKNTLKDNIKEYLLYLRENQDTSGGFGWFDYDAVSLESTVVAARAYHAAASVDIEMNPFVGSSMSAYFVSVIESPERSIHDKILAYDGLSLVNIDSSRMYVYKMIGWYEDDPEANTSPLTIVFLMDAFNNIGNTGASKELVVDLSEVAIRNENMIHWEDADSLYRVGQDPAYVTALAYSALTPLEEWDMKYEVRNWLMRDLANSSLHSTKFNEIIYYLAVADQDALYFVRNSAEITVVVNDVSVASIVMNDDDIYSRNSVKITSDMLKKGENKIRLEKNGSAELYSVLNINQKVQASEDEVYFAINRRLLDLETGEEIKDGVIDEDTLIKVVVEVMPKENYKDVVIRDFIPTGFVPVTLGYDKLPELITSTFYSACSCNANRWGTASRDYISFVEEQMLKGTKYSFEYLAIAGVKGEISSGGTHVYLNLLPEVQSFIQSDSVSIE